MSTRRSPKQIAAAVEAEMESHLNAQGYRNFHRALVKEVNFFIKSKKVRDVIVPKVHESGSKAAPVAAVK